jgi:hypothetical protein
MDLSAKVLEKMDDLSDRFQAIERLHIEQNEII